MTCGCRVYEGKRLPPAVEFCKRATIVAWLALAIWWLWPWAVDGVVENLLGMTAQDPIGDVLRHFLLEFGFTSLTFLLLIYGIAFVRPASVWERYQPWLCHHGHWLGYVGSVIVGSIVPLSWHFTLPIAFGIKQARLSWGTAWLFIAVSAVSHLWCYGSDLGLSTDWSVLSIVALGSVVVAWIIDRIVPTMPLEPIVFDRPDAEDCSCCCDPDQVRSSLPDRYPYAWAEAHHCLIRYGWLIPTLIAVMEIFVH